MFKQSLLPVTSQNNQPINLVKKQRVDQSEHGDFLGERSKLRTSDASTKLSELPRKKIFMQNWRLKILG